MQYVGLLTHVPFLSVASNDNEDLLSFQIPSFDLSLIRDIKRELREENALTGMLLSSTKAQRFFQEVNDAERYIVLRYFTPDTPEQVLRELKRRILDRYLFPKVKRRRKKPAPQKP